MLKHSYDFMWLTPRTASTVKTARGSSTVHTPRAMISFDRKEGVEPNTSWQSHLIRSSRNIAAFKVKGPNNTNSISSRVCRRELWYTKSTVWAWKRNLERGEWETETGRQLETGRFVYLCGHWCTMEKKKKDIECHLIWFLLNICIYMINLFILTV